MIKPRCFIWVWLTEMSPIKSIGLSVYYGAPLSTLVWRVPLYIVVGAAEGTVLVLLARNKLFTGELNRARSKKERGSRT